MEIKLAKKQLVYDISQADYALTPRKRYLIHTDFKDINGCECLLFSDQIDDDDDDVIIPWDDVTVIRYETETNEYTVRSQYDSVDFQLFKLLKNHN